ncbi:hypothetical protein MPNT_20164 [Candidatus Methylacidithermus pantelleriae]|uniref:Uncharacterized protein n=1 Tax=Candidatus Methylacidithermus pantelleriae TaxID=2744239 RepID=A0A8J2BI18_9BACT|nr:hypothetical protein MPNT_20164 [Candidatus Methylacidithermus pantelleriae]
MRHRIIFTRRKKVRHHAMSEDRAEKPTKVLWFHIRPFCFASVIDLHRQPKRCSGGWG